MKNNSIILFARFISIAFSPIVVTGLYIYFIFSKYPLYSLEISMVLTIYIIIFLPAYVIKLLKSYPKIQLGEDLNREDRVLVFFALATASLINLSLLLAFDNYGHLVKLNIILFLYWGIFFLINYMIDKVSVHSGWFTFTLMAIGGTYPIVFLGFLFIPLLAWSRLTLHKHTWFQIIFGSVIGAFIGILAWVV
jgi:hypothetical protein